MRRVNQKRGRLSAPELLLCLIVGSVAIILLLGSFFSDAEAHNNNVKTGEVEVADYVYKLCDKNNLIYIYRGDGITISPNDPQCK